jgi:hypothetical protein
VGCYRCFFTVKRLKQDTWKGLVEGGLCTFEMGWGGSGRGVFSVSNWRIFRPHNKKRQNKLNGGENLRANFFTLFSEKVKGEHFSTCYFILFFSVKKFCIFGLFLMELTGLFFLSGLLFRAELLKILARSWQVVMQAL